MSEEKGSRFLATDLSLFSVKAPDALGIGDRDADVVSYVVEVLGDLKKNSYPDSLRAWIGNSAIKGVSPWQCESLPPLPIIRFPDLLGKLWGWQRLLAYEYYKFEYDMAFYESYLYKFYGANKFESNAMDIISQCLATDRAMCSAWKAKRTPNVPIDLIQCPRIEAFMSDLLNDPTIISRYPFVTYAAACITKEAELMMEWVRQGYVPEDEDADICYETRDAALGLARIEGDWPVHPAAAVLLGLAKEAVFLLNNAKNGRLVAPEISRNIRLDGVAFLDHKLGEFTKGAHLTPELSDDEVDSADEGDHLAGGNTEDAGFVENEMQEQHLTQGHHPDEDGMF